MTVSSKLVVIAVVSEILDESSVMLGAIVDNAGATVVSAVLFMSRLSVVVSCVVFSFSLGKAVVIAEFSVVERVKGLVVVISELVLFNNGFVDEVDFGMNDLVVFVSLIVVDLIS